jgi:hypothetical protein
MIKTYVGLFDRAISGAPRRAGMSAAERAVSAPALVPEDVAGEGRRA